VREADVLKKLDLPLREDPKIMEPRTLKETPFLTEKDAVRSILEHNDDQMCEDLLAWTWEEL
jgi:hypothetical protein